MNNMIGKMLDNRYELLEVIGSGGKVINKIIVFGSVYLGIVALLPIIAGNLMEGVKNLAIGGTSVIIVVGVALETVQALESQMLMRQYKGFLE